MNPQDPLAALHPLREPNLIGWWPLAPGWWLLLALVLLATATAAYLLLRYRRATAYRRRALLQLQTLHSDFQASGDNSRYLTQLNALLKSVALVAYPRRDIAAQHGQDWRSFLNQSAKPGPLFSAEFATAAYERSCPQLDVEQTQQAAQHWIKNHRSAS